MAKKGQGSVLLSDLLIYGWAILLVMVAVGALFYFDVFDLRFEPEKEVCTSFEGIAPEDCREIHTYNSTEFKGMLDGEVRCFGDYYWVCDNTQMSESHKCTSWRSKNICDTDPNNEQCVCDEMYMPIKDAAYRLGGVMLLIETQKQRNQTADLFQDLVNKIDTYEKPTCTSAHLRGWEE